ncbi:SAM-dependent methyltransferase [Sphingomonas rhizophila]|uniref:SAM-dependent methyltransferase n=1 Tax=Sphingomonas rhizophila TaxID=2071607 RepID=UPI001FECC803|nr:SAM-dependent methyltransferase [Sphingomonas rhizophila]
MTPLEQALRERIRTGGPIGVDAYMEACNSFYYATRDPLGTAGDFTTAPEISQMFGEMVGAALADCWHRAGRPGGTRYVELGPGRGTLAADALRVLRSAGFGCPVDLVETSPVLRDLQRQQHPDATFHDDLTTIGTDGPILLVANEFFDALPVRQLVDGQERRVTITAGQLAFDRDGAIVEQSPQRSEVATDLARRLDAQGGAALVIDYGYTEGASGDTLQAVHAHQFAYVLERPGEHDLTAHVDFAVLAAAARDGGARVGGPVSQGNWLETLV